MTVTSGEYDLFGVDVIYTPKATSIPVSVRAIMMESFDNEQAADVVSHKGEIRLQISEVSARPDYFDKFTVTDGAGNDQDWFIVSDGVRERQVMLDFAGEWICKISRDERPVWG